MEHLRGAGPVVGLGSGADHGAGRPGPGDGLGDAPGLGDPLALACPRCGSALPPDPPSVGEILAARRTPGE